MGKLYAAGCRDRQAIIFTRLSPSATRTFARASPKSVPIQTALWRRPVLQGRRTLPHSGTKRAKNRRFLSYGFWPRMACSSAGDAAPAVVGGILAGAQLGDDDFDGNTFRAVGCAARLSLGDVSHLYDAKLSVSAKASLRILLIFRSKLKEPAL